MPKGSEELTRARKQEIIDACASLYETMSFKEISIKEIGKATSLARTAIYHYFQTKEEIFLALLQQEYQLWNHDLQKLYDTYEKISAENFAEELAHSLEKRTRLLKLMSMNHYDMEGSSRMENLIEFKSVYGTSLRIVASCLEKFFPKMSMRDIQNFIYTFFPFLFGVYPYTVVTDKQKKAMDEAQANYVFLSLYEITYTCVIELLKNYK